MRVRFYIEKRKGGDGELLTKRRPIFMTVAFHGERVLLSTGKFVDLKRWDPGKQRVKESSIEATEINHWLDTLEYSAGATWKALAGLSEKPGARLFRSEFEKLKPRFSGGFFEILILFMEDGYERWNSGTYKKVRGLQKTLRDFEKRENLHLGFDTMNEEFITRFKVYGEKRGWSKVTIYKTVNLLIWYLNWATKKGYNVYPHYRGFYKILDNDDKKPLEPLVLEWDELLKLYSMKLELPMEERVRDLFCLMCFTGMRMSELGRLEKRDVFSDRILVPSYRGNRELPLNKYARELLDKYSNRYYRDNRALPPVSMVTVNKYLHIIGEKAGLERKVDDRKGEEKVYLWQALTAGVATKTFIMHALKLGIPEEVIASFTGVARDQRVRLLRERLERNEMNKFDNIESQ